MQIFIKKYFSTITIKKQKNQALELAKYAIKFIQRGHPAPQVIERTKMLHTDSVIAGFSAITLKTNAPYLFRTEAQSYGLSKNPKQQHAKVFGSSELVPIDKAILANCSAVAQWGANGTFIGHNSDTSRQAGQFSHNDFYPVIIAASHANSKLNGTIALRAMVLQDQIRGRLCQVFSLQKYKIDHGLYGAIGSICTYGALVGASPITIEHAIGMLVAHYTPWTAIRNSQLLTDSKGASSALTTEAAIKCIKRSMRGFIGPKNIFSNPQSLFCWNEKTNGSSPFDLTVSNEGSDFVVMNTNFKLGIYEYHSAAAIECVHKIIHQSKLTSKYSLEDIQDINIIVCNPIFDKISDPANTNPSNRHSACQSTIYLISTILRKAFKNNQFNQRLHSGISIQQVWKSLMLQPKDYSHNSLFHAQTRLLMKKCTVSRGDPVHDRNYPQGTPTQIIINLKSGQKFESGLIIFPSGHHRNTSTNTKQILNNKNNVLGRIAMNQTDLKQKLTILNSLQCLSNLDLQRLYQCNINNRKNSIDSENYIE